MSSQYCIEDQGVQASPLVAQQMSKQLTSFVHPLLTELDKGLDLRLVQTFLATLHVLLEFRHRNNGLLLSELGGYLATPEHAPAGTKRLSNLLHSPNWSSGQIEEYLWQQADARLVELEQRESPALLLWDESVVEKPESIKLEGLCAVRSSKARRLKRIKPGYYNPPGGPPICVPGMHWITLVLLGRQGPPTLASMQWWTTRGILAISGREKEAALLDACQQRWGRRVIHVFDQGFAGSPRLGECFQRKLRFILRWNKEYHLRDAEGNTRRVGRISGRRRSWGERQVWDARRRQWFQAGVVAIPVTHPDYQQPLWLVVSRPGKGRPPWYLLTTEPITCEDDAWKVVFAYARRWQIEMTYRFSKSELACESPRLWKWETRLRLLLMVSLVYSFLLTLLDVTAEKLKVWLLRFWCHRTGKRCRQATAPLYRLRWALSRLWLAYPPLPHPLC
jgi:Transposase DDE domain